MRNTVKAVANIGLSEVQAVYDGTGRFAPCVDLYINMLQMQSPTTR